MKNLRTLFILILSHVLALNVLQSQVNKLPDFSKAEKISHEELKAKTSLVSSGAHLQILNACEIGSYDITIYFEKEGTLYEVISVQLRCMNQGYFATLPAAEIKQMSSGIDAMGLGHWYILAHVGCGKIFEYKINKFGAVGYEYEVNCN